MTAGTARQNSAAATKSDMPVGAPSVADLVSRAVKISAHIEATASEAERNRRMPDEIVDMIASAGIYQMLVPKRYGGFEMKISDMAQVMKALSPLDTSTGWITAFYIGHNWMWCLLPEEAQQEIFANGPSALGPVMVAPSVSATPVDGGFRVSGRAKWGTGSSHAQWCMVSGIVKSGTLGPPDIRMFAMPWSEARVEDTWHTSGMAATASHDVLFDAVFVPAHRVLDITATRSGKAPGTQLHANTLYATPFTPFLCFIAAAPLVAVARGITVHAIERAKAFVSSYSGRTSIDNPALQIRLAKADMISRAAETLLDDLVRDLEQHAQNAPVDVEDRVLMRAKASYIASLCREVVTLLAQGSGASAHMIDSPIQRAFRDINMASCHVVFDQDPTMELRGKMLVGTPPAIILA